MPFLHLCSGVSHCELAASKESMHQTQWGAPNSKFRGVWAPQHAGWTFSCAARHHSVTVAATDPTSICCLLSRSAIDVGVDADVDECSQGLCGGTSDSVFLCKNTAPGARQGTDGRGLGYQCACQPGFAANASDANGATQCEGAQAITRLSH